MELKNKLALGVVFFIIASAIFIRINARINPVEHALIINGKVYPTLVARTQSELYHGLGDRDNLGHYVGMYFDFYEEGSYGIVMRGMRFPLDVLWLKGETVVQIEENIPLQPGVAEEGLKSYINVNPADAVVELGAGKVRELNIKVGDKIIYCENSQKCPN